VLGLHEMQVAGSLVFPSRAVDWQAPQIIRGALEMRFDIIRSAGIFGQLDFSKFALFHTR